MKLLHLGIRGRINVALGGIILRHLSRSRFPKRSDLKNSAKHSENSNGAYSKPQMSTTNS